MKTYVAETCYGLEDICQKELEEKLKISKSQVFEIRGFVSFENEKLEKYEQLRSVYNIYEYLGKTKLTEKRESLKRIIEFFRKNPPEDLLSAKSFRVTCSRYGHHEFKSIEVERFVGEYFYENFHIPVDLRNPDKELFVKIVGNTAYLMLKHNKKPLEKRNYRVFLHPTAADPILAYGMFRLAEIKEGEIVVDPMCGSGTILIESALEFPKAKYFGIDISEKFLEGAKQNAKVAGVDHLIKFIHGDCRNLESYFEKIDKIITNPPYGVKMGNEKSVKGLYYKFLESAGKVVRENGRIVLTVLRGNMFRMAIFRTKFFKIVEERIVKYGGLFTHLFVLEKI